MPDLRYHTFLITHTAHQLARAQGNSTEKRLENGWKTVGKPGLSPARSLPLAPLALCQPVARPLEQGTRAAATYP
eukprot:935011-Rhodomonas_salina.1